MRHSVQQMFSACGQAMDALFWLVCAGALALLAGGCADNTPEFTEVKRIHEKVTEAELETFLRVVGDLPDGKLPPLASPFAPPPDWDHERTLPVGELVDEELKSLSARFDVAKLARPLQKNRRLLRALRREQMTPEQFVGLSLTIGVALSRSQLREDQDLDEIVAQGEAAIERLKQITEPFHLHSPDRRYRVLREAVWITRVGRAKMLRQVPPENYQQLVSQHRDELLAVLPECFSNNVLDEVADLLEERGTPFEELADSGNDAEITWDPKVAIIGRDRPDDESGGD